MNGCSVIEIWIQKTRRFEIELQQPVVEIQPVVQIEIDDLSGPEIAALLEEHLASMRSHSPPESVHALPLEELRRPEITIGILFHEKN